MPLPQVSLHRFPPLRSAAHLGRAGGAVLGQGDGAVLGQGGGAVLGQGGVLLVFALAAQLLAALELQAQFSNLLEEKKRWWLQVVVTGGGYRWPCAGTAGVQAGVMWCRAPGKNNRKLHEPLGWRG